MEFLKQNGDTNSDAKIDDSEVNETLCTSGLQGYGYAMDMVPNLDIKLYQPFYICLDCNPGADQDMNSPSYCSGCAEICHKGHTHLNYFFE